MANERRLRQGLQWGTITDSPLTNVATTVNSAAFAALPAVAATEHLVLVLDPGATAGAPEIVWVTAHTAAATSLTVVRAREGSAARQHASGIQWIHPPTVRDFLQVGATFAGLAAGLYPGERAYDLAMKKPYIWNGTDWSPEGAGGALGYAQAVANQTGITAEADLTGLTTTVTVATGRRVKITASYLVDSTVVNDDAIGRIKEGATVLQAAVVRVPLNAQGYNFEKTVVLTPSAGAHTYKLSLARAAGTGNISMLASATLPAFILVEDIGPV